MISPIYVWKIIHILGKDDFQRAGSPNLCWQLQRAIVDLYDVPHLVNSAIVLNLLNDKINGHVCQSRFEGCALGGFFAGTMFLHVDGKIIEDSLDEIIAVWPSSSS
eukprot:8957918-Heterocapsa_arctica.AAC.2